MYPRVSNLFKIEIRKFNLHEIIHFSLQDFENQSFENEKFTLIKAKPFFQFDHWVKKRISSKNDTSQFDQYTRVHSTRFSYYLKKNQYL